MKKVVVLGSTGSIGVNTLKVIENNSDALNLFAIAGNKNIDLLAAQALKFKCRYVVCSEEHVEELRKKLPSSVKILFGVPGMVEISSMPEVDIVLCAVVGTSGLNPVISAIQHKKDIALASKEILVMAGSIVMAEAAKYGVKILPVDSEHSAIFQCLEGRDKRELEKVILTASGGAFRDFRKEELEKVTFREAMNHPTWDMGPKITLDSATLMNKALEVVEAHWLFNVTAEQIDVVIHPESIIHSMIELIDGTILAQMSITDMKFPIQHALLYPEKRCGFGKLSLARINQLNFQELDKYKYPSIDFAYECIRKGGTLGSVMNAANEIAADKFKDGKISLPKIWDIVRITMEKHSSIKSPTLEEIIDADNWARSFAMSL